MEVVVLCVSERNKGADDMDKGCHPQSAGGSQVAQGSGAPVKDEGRHGSAVVSAAGEGDPLAARNQLVHGRPHTTLCREVDGREDLFCWVQAQHLCQQCGHHALQQPFPCSSATWYATPLIIVWGIERAWPA